MYKFYVNKNSQSTGEHEVHQEGCSYMPNSTNLFYLGLFTDCHGAVTAAKRYYNSVDGCYYCARVCHRR
jgi:hypothetical protein